MPAIGYNEELAEVQRTRLSAAITALVGDESGPRAASDRLAAALDTLAEGVVSEAALWEKYKKKGWQSTKREMLTTAGKLRDLAKEADRYTIDAARSPGERDPKRGIEPGGDPSQDGVAPRAPIASPFAPGNGQPDDVAANLAAQARDEQDAEDARLEGEREGLTTAERIEAGLPVVPTADSLAIFSDNGAGAAKKMIDDVHTEARTMLDERRATATDGDPFTDPLPPGSSALANVAPMTLADLMTPQPVPADLKHWSYSQLSSLDECEVKYAARKIFQKPSLPQWALVGGRALHAAVDVIERRILAPDSAPENWGSHEEIWHTAFQHEIDATVDETGILPADWRAANKGSENYDWWRVSGADMVKLYVKQRADGYEAAARAGVAPRKLFGLNVNGSTQPVLELELAIPVPGPMGQLEFRAVLDQAWLCHDGTLLIVDLKSGRQMPSSFDTFQLGSQAIVLAQHLNIQPPAPFVKACYYDARKGIFTDPIEPLARHSLDELVYRMHTAEMRRQTGIYRPNVSTRTCTGCGARSLCPLVGA